MDADADQGRLMSDDIDLPDWLPLLARKQAGKAYKLARASGSAEYVTIVTRVTTDIRMKKVWTTESFSTRAEWMQQIALGSTYNLMLHLGQLILPSRTGQTSAPRRDWPQELRNLPNVFENQAAALRDAAQRWSSWIETASQTQTGFHAQLAKKILELRRLADDFDGLRKAWDETWTFRTDAEEARTALVAHVARRMQELFGTPMYGQSATIASVVLDLEVTSDPGP
jgi:hypothetical protein